jgi:aspartate racemase
MKTVGLIGGISWQSTLDYYREINTETGRRLTPMHSAPIFLASLNFHDVRELTLRDDEEGVFQLFLRAAHALKQSGADLMALCANTAHRRAARLQQEVGLPLVHIADATAAALRREGLSRVGLLGTRRTMEEPFLKARLSMDHGLEVLTPDTALRAELDACIFGEMVQGVFSEDARTLTTRACRSLRDAGAQGVVLGCTELPILMREADVGIPLFDTTRLHAAAIVDAALS